MQITRPTRLLAVVAVAALAGVAACGDDDGDDAATAGESEATPAPAAEADGTGDPAGVVDVEMTDYEFLGLPDRVPAGTSLAVTNSSDSELHEVVALRLPDDEERSVEELIALPPEEAQAAVGGPPVMVLLAEPGGPQIAAVGDGTLSEPGRYVLLCMIPTGADPAEYLEAAAESAGPPEVSGGPPHVVHGMYAELIVE